MQLRKHTNPPAPPAAPVFTRVLADTDGPWDDALVFAASSIINEMKSRSYNGQIVIREVRTERGVYTLFGKHSLTPAGPRPTVSISAEPVPPHLGATREFDKLRQRFRLTRKEVRVAQLLASHSTNAEIAAELCISPHTARHHTQSVLEKLGVRSRRDVAGMLNDQ